MADAYSTRLGAPFLMQPVTLSAFTLNQSADAVEFVFQAEDAATITRLGFRQGAVTGTAPTYRVSLQGVTTGGVPDGTILASGSAYADVTPVAGGDGTWQWVTLGASYACSRGEALAVVITYQTGTINSSNCCSFNSSLSGWGGGQPKVTHNDNGSRSTQSGIGIFGYGSSTRAYGRPLETTTTFNVASNTTPDEVGFLVSLPAGWGATYKIAGLRFVSGNSAGDVTLTLYDTDGTTILQQVTTDADLYRNASGALLDFWFDEATLSTLSFGSTYRAVMTPGTTSARPVYYVEADADADLDAWPCGQYLTWTERTDAGSWTNRGNRRPIAELIITDWTEPAASTAPVAVQRVIQNIGTY